jgi:hypothetical protein
MAKTRKQPRTQIYEIHDNGGRPFIVHVTGKRVEVMKNMNTWSYPTDSLPVEHKNPPKHLFTVQADEVMIGKHSPNGDYDGLSAKEGDGNSILLKVGPKYIYIGDFIYEFAPVKGDTIIKYYSNIGNSDVPYPYAIGKTHVYIMIDKVAVEKSYFNMKGDIYEQHWYETYGERCSLTEPCDDKATYEARVAEWKSKKVPLKVKVLQKRAW